MIKWILGFAGYVKVPESVITLSKSTEVLLGLMKLEKSMSDSERDKKWVARIDMQIKIQKKVTEFLKAGHGLNESAKRLADKLDFTK